MNRKKVKIWLFAMIINLIFNVLMHFCVSCNITLNYLASVIAAFALGFFVQEYYYGKNDR